MAEERLMDDDKDRKYKIRKNADGEDELVIENPPEEEDEEEVGFEVPEFETDDEEAAVMTPEQLAAREKARSEEAERRRKKVENGLFKAGAYIAEEEFDNALYVLSEIEELTADNADAAVLKLKALTRNLTYFSMSAEAAKTAVTVEKFATAEQKAELLAASEKLTARIDELKLKSEELNAENEERKAERREVFAERRKKAVLWFTVTAVPFVAFLVLAVVFATMIFARQDGVNVVLTIVFAALALVTFIATVITLRGMLQALRNSRLNEKNSATKLGREYEAARTELEQLTRIYAAIK